MKLEIFYQRMNDANIAKDAVSSVYKDFLETEITCRKEPSFKGFNPSRRQYNASVLLLEFKNLKNLFLWLVSKDLYVEGMNFVFGCALPYRGAILSTYRLDSNKLIWKEVVHEIGHVLGLQHCKNYCVMQFSNSLQEAKLKPSTLCEDCKRKLNRLWRE